MCSCFWYIPRNGIAGSHDKSCVCVISVLVGTILLFLPVWYKSIPHQHFLLCLSGNSCVERGEMTLCFICTALIATDAEHFSFLSFFFIMCYFFFLPFIFVRLFFDNYQLNSFAQLLWLFFKKSF